jgi:MATE family multidrug resistance protein
MVTTPPAGARSLRPVPARDPHEPRGLFSLALPIIGTQIALVAMPWTDALVMARLGGDELAGGALGATLLSTAFVLVSCLFAGVGPMVARAIAAPTRGDASALVPQARIVALVCAGALVLPIAWAEPLLRLAGQPESVARHAADYLAGASLAVIATPLTIVQRHVLGAHRRPHVATSAFAIAVPLNAGLDDVLARGLEGWAPRMGVFGVGVATSAVSVGVTLAISGWVRATGAGLEVPWLARPSPIVLRRITAMGLPVVVSVLAEVGVFVASSFVVGTFGAASLAAHQVAMQVTQLLFVVPNGLAQATALYVAHAADVRSATRTALAFAALWSLGAAAGLFAMRPWIVALYLADAADSTRDLAMLLLTVMAAFQIADGLQVVAAGALRGRGDTQTAMRTALVAYAIAVPTIAAAALWTGLGPVAIWIGLAGGLLIAAFHLTARALAVEHAGPGNSTRELG